ncbi:hypothetical protein MmiEs2_06040 [Methanimicrococcus stummii]|uniref:Uncharacterized protein n=1 Tax=Methanimicrococcus stummii TaxID=3028294 RepID=A0AA96V803_9EURY|nr:hypothetical protein [Methanimicrococcus sp. Es2]WNY28419.1 hypothetical protein MmiEs2_06040 [Methanimicrococcus sp. Es2]
MNSKNRIFFLTILLLLTIFIAGTAVAAADDDFDSEPIEPVLNYPSLVYISGTTVTIELNNGISSDSPNYYSVDYYDVSGPDGSSGMIYYNNSKIDLIQFEAAKTGSYVVHLCGSFLKSEYKSPVYESTHRGQYITFNVVDLNEGDENQEPNLFIYPDKSYFTYTCGSTDRIFHTSYYNHLFSEEIYPDFSEELSENDVILNLYGNNLRSVSWYDSGLKVISLAGDRTIEYSGSSSGTPVGKIEISDYKPEINVNVSKIPELDLNFIFVCSDHDSSVYVKSTRPDLEIVNETFESVPVSFSKCDSVFEWQAFVNDSFKQNSADFFLPYVDDETDENEDGNENGNGVGNENEEFEDLYPHYVLFNDLSLLRDDLSLSKTIQLSVYPKLIDETENDPDAGRENEDDENKNENSDEGIEPDLTWISSSIPFTIKRVSQSYPIYLVSDGDKLNLVLKTDAEPPEVPDLSKLAFPTTVNDLFEGGDVELIVDALTEKSIENIETDLITDEVPIHSVLNIDFSSAAVKDSLNEQLNSENEFVVLEFEVPAIDSLGNPISGDDLTVFHIIEVDGVQTMEKLNAKITSKGIGDEKYFVITAYTTGFSPFVIASVESEKTLSSSSDPFGHAAIVPENEPEEEEVQNPESYSNDIPKSIVSDIVTKVQGHLSVFSILVVLTSGLFMWDYIRRRI